MINKKILVECNYMEERHWEIVLFLCPDNFKEFQKLQLNKIKTELRLQ